MSRAVGPLTFRSHLAAPADEVWAHASTMTGVNYELGPLLRMTHPPSAETLGPDVGSLVLLGGVPIDLHRLHFESIDPGRGFRERSTTLAQREWRHDRSVEQVGTGSTVTDVVTFRPRVVLLAPVLRRIVVASIAHRHEQLRRRFGNGGAAASGA